MKVWLKEVFVIIFKWWRRNSGPEFTFGAKKKKYLTKIIVQTPTRFSERL